MEEGDNCQCSCQCSPEQLSQSCKEYQVLDNELCECIDKDCGAKPQKYCNAKTLEFLKLENDLYDTWILKASLVEVQAMKCEWDHSKKDL